MGTLISTPPNRSTSSVSISRRIVIKPSMGSLYWSATSSHRAAILLLLSLPWVLATPLMRKLPETLASVVTIVSRGICSIFISPVSLLKWTYKIISVMPSLTLESLAAPADRSPVDERSTPVTRMLNSLPWNSLGVLMSWFSLMLPPAGVMAPMMSANAPPKISAMTSSVMSRICHQRIFFFFFPFPPLPLPPFLPDFLPFALCGASSSSRGGLRLPPLPPAAVRGLWAAGCGASACFARRGCAAASSSRMPPTGAACCTGACAWGRGAGCCPCRGAAGCSYSWAAACRARCSGSGGRFTVRRGRCT